MQYLKDGRSVIVRAIKEEDAEGVLEYYDIISKESDFLSFGSEGPGLTLEGERELIKRYKEKRSFNLIFEIGGEIAGLTSITVREDRVRLHHYSVLGISALKKYWGFGLGNIMMDATIAEAKKRGLVKINLEVRVDNTVGINLYKKFGFEVEGKIKKALLINGVYYDNYLMGKELD